MLDTDICVYWLNGKEEIKQKIQEIGLDYLNTTIITLGELKYGAYYSKNVEHNLKKIRDFLRKVNLLNIEEKSIEEFGKIKAELRKKGEMIGDFDILIASIAISNNCILVTNNEKHYKRINSLKIENWL